MLAGNRVPSQVALVGAVLAVLAMLGGASSASAQGGSPSPSPQPSAGQELVATPAIGPVGTESIVQLRNWPAGATVQISTCGNNALNGNADCDNEGSISATTREDGSFTGQTKFTKPPKPCPCVLFAFSSQSQQVVRFPIELTGYPTAPPVAQGGSRSLEIRAEVEGGGPLASWLGGAAERTLILTIINSGTIPVDNPPTVVTLGRGEDPTQLLTQPDLGQVVPGQTSEVRIPFELPPGSFGSYTVKTTVGGLDQPTAARASTSTYPWFLLVGGWLLIQIPLLGLHKRRADDGEDLAESELLELDDPFRGLVPSGSAVLGAPAVASAGAVSAGAGSVPSWASSATGLAAGAAVAAGAATAVLDRSGGPVPAADAGMPGWAAAAVATEVAAVAVEPSAPVTPSGQPSAVAAIAAAIPGAAAGAAAAGAAAAGSGRSTYGVDHLLGIVSPGTEAVAPATVAARVVVGGVAPRR